MSSSFPSSRPCWAVAGGILFFTILLLITFGWSSPSGGRWRTTVQYTGSESLRDVSNRTLGFQKIFVINLPSRTDHKDSMTLAAHFSGIDVEFIDGVTEVEDKTLPPHDFNFPRPVLGAWRAHMNIASRLIADNIQSALVIEDDADWDLRLKQQMRDFAKASQLLLQPKTGTSDEFHDSTNPRVSDKDEPQNYDLNTPGITKASSSPYGDIDRWDLFWLGHCGTRFARPTDPTIPLGRVAYPDETVPETQHIELQFGNDELMTQYPNHTRVVHRAAGNVCTLGYAISLPGARRMLYEFSVKKLTNSMDLMLNGLCEGIDGRKMRTCLSVQPQLFQHHRAVGSKTAQSDIAEHPDEWNPVAFTKNIRQSARVNFPKLIDGETDYIDSFPDGAEPRDLGF